MKFQSRNFIDCDWARIELLPGAPYSSSDAKPIYTFGLAFERQRGVHAIGCHQREDFDAWPGEFACTAPDIEIFSESKRGGEYLTLHVIGASLGGIPDRPPTQQRAVFRGDKLALRLGWRLRRLLLAPRRDCVAIEEQAALLADHGWSRLAAPHRRSSRYDLHRKAHAQVLDRIEDDLSGPLSLNELARMAGLPKLRFLRSFTDSVGVTPHAYVTERRLQRARKLLQSSDVSLAAIAVECGFAHQSHLGAVLKERLGLSTLRYRTQAQRTAAGSTDSISRSDPL